MPREIARQMPSDELFCNLSIRPLTGRKCTPLLKGAENAPVSSHAIRETVSGGGSHRAGVVARLPLTSSLFGDDDQAVVERSTPWSWKKNARFRAEPGVVATVMGRGYGSKELKS